MNKLLKYYYTLNPTSLLAILIAVFLPSGNNGVQAIGAAVRKYQETHDQTPAFNGIHVYFKFFVYAQPIVVDLHFMGLEQLYKWVDTIAQYFTYVNFKIYTYDITDLKARYLFYLQGIQHNNGEGMRLKSDPDNKYSRYVTYKKYDELHSAYKDNFRKQVQKLPCDNFVSYQGDFLGAHNNDFKTWLRDSDFDWAPGFNHVNEYIGVTDLKKQEALDWAK